MEELPEAWPEGRVLKPLEEVRIPLRVLSCFSALLLMLGDILPVQGFHCHGAVTLESRGTVRMGWRKESRELELFSLWQC